MRRRVVLRPGAGRHHELSKAVRCCSTSQALRCCSTSQALPLPRLARPTLPAVPLRWWMEGERTTCSGLPLHSHSRAHSLCGRFSWAARHALAELVAPHARCAPLRVSSAIDIPSAVGVRVARPCYGAESGKALSSPKLTKLGDEERAMSKEREALFGDGQGRAHPTRASHLTQAVCMQGTPDASEAAQSSPLHRVDSP